MFVDNVAVRTLLLASAAAILTTAQAGAAETAPARSASAEASAQPNTEDDTIEVVGTVYGYQPIEVKQDSPFIVDSVSYDDVEAPTGDNSIASMVVQVPGISYEGDGDEPRYITIRGLSADLNVTTLDGLTLATLGENGGGTRRVNLQLVPADISERVDVYKAFTAEQDSAAIGGVTDIISRSALRSRKPYFMIDGYGIYSTFKGPAGENSGGSDRAHWGMGFKTAAARTFGSDDQFGIVFTARYQERARNANKNWPDQRTYFNEAGGVIAGPDPELGWDGKDSLTKFAFGDYSNTITNKGATLKLEWQATPVLSTYVMGYLYNRREDSTMNSSDIIGLTNGVTNRTETTGEVRVNYVQSVVRYNQWNRTGKGLISGMDWDIGDASSLSLRGGYSKETYKDDEYWTRVRTTSNALSYTYKMDGLPQLTSLIGDPFASTYALNGSNINYNRAWEDVIDLRADYTYNVGRHARGFGFKAGVKWTRLRIDKDVDSVRYVTGGNVDHLMYDPGYSHYGSNGMVLPWINYDRYWNGGLPAEDTAASALHSRNVDYRYEEEIANAYLSLYYRTDTTQVVAGLRYDDASYKGRAPLTVNGTLTDDFSRPRGNYSFWLPSLNVTHDLSDSWKLRGSVSRSIGRPTPGSIVQPETQTCGEGVTGCTISRGNPDLKPRKANNFDLALEHYFNGGDSLIALTAFHKEIKDDIFTLTTDVEQDGVVNRFRQPLNAETSKVQGLELAFVNRSFSFLPNLGASFNITALKGKMSYVADNVERPIDRILSQPDWMANLTLTYRIPQIDGALRVSANYQDDYMSSIGANKWADMFVKGRPNVDLAFWHKVGRDFTFKYEIDNVLNAEPEWYHGRNVNGTISQRDEYGQGIYFHIIYSPGR